MQKLRDQALRMGEVVDDNIEEWKTSLSLSPWNPVMIIVPPTIVDTWRNAFQTFSHFPVSFYCGRTKVDAIENVLYGSADILLVPKSMFQDEAHSKELERIKWKLIIIDEFHNFKNHNAKISKHLRRLKAVHQPLVLGMTGTPMQNNHTELWNLVDLIETNYFGTKDEFRVNIERPITLGRYVLPLSPRRVMFYLVHLKSTNIIVFVLQTQMRGPESESTKRSSKCGVEKRSQYDLH
jgi:SNF2 family DNA or RNA helicase